MPNFRNHEPSPNPKINVDYERAAQLPTETLRRMAQMMLPRPELLAEVGQHFGEESELYMRLSLVFDPVDVTSSLDQWAEFDAIIDSYGIIFFDEAVPPCFDQEA